ncbi:MAG: tRNA (adenosine(37)-N6)-dimethylallyltransferase MiaA [Bacteroidales bacterium]|nr:tRNA (adenosine(37)-N6)-dimethylallyltransferase MiaA [Bacteroidales bacterium]
MGKKREIQCPPPAELPAPEEIDVEGILRSFLSGETDIVCVLGPTASGKTRYAVALARKFAGLGTEAEIISADSRQVYRGMDIGTGKDLVEYGEIPYHLIDIVPAGTRYSLYDYQRDFEEAYKDIRERGRLPIICGGTGLYIQAALSGFSLPEIPPDEALRESLEQEDIEELREKLLELRPVTDQSILESKRRTIRALEVALYENEHPEVRRADYTEKKAYYIGTLVSREDRTARIDRRLEERLAEGMVEEVKGLLDAGVDSSVLMGYGLEYKFITQYILGINSYEEMKTLLGTAIHQFAKRQMTWFRGMERKGVRIHWTLV